MKVAILSDIHDNIWKLADLLAGLQKLGAEALVCCGDLCAPFTLKQIAESFSGPVHVVRGNNDGDMFFLSKVASGFDHVTLYSNPFAYLTLGGCRVAVNHYPEIARDQALSGQYDLVCHGHDHIAHVERLRETLLVNPGEVMGRLGKSTYALYDTENGQVEIVDI